MQARNIRTHNAQSGVTVFVRDIYSCPICNKLSDDLNMASISSLRSEMQVSRKATGA